MGDILKGVGKGLKSLVMGAKHMREEEKLRKEQERLGMVIANMGKLEAAVSSGDTESASRIFAAIRAQATDLKELDSLYSMRESMKKANTEDPIKAAETNIIKAIEDSQGSGISATPPDRIGGAVSTGGGAGVFEQDARIRQATSGSVTADPRQEITKTSAGPYEIKPVLTEGDVAKSKLQVQQQTESQEAKKSEELERLSKTAYAKMGTMFSKWLDVVARTKAITGVPPGPQQAPLTAILGATRINEFQEAFKGAEPEYAAAIGRMAVPGARSVRLIDLFKKGAASAWSSIPSGIINSAASAAMQFGGYLAGEEGSRLLEEESGIKYDPMNPQPYIDMQNRKVKEFEKLYIDGLYQIVYTRYPDLLPDDVRDRLDAELEAELKKREDPKGKKTYQLK